MEHALAHTINFMLNDRHVPPHKLKDLLEDTELSEADQQSVLLYTLSICGRGAQNPANAILPLIPVGTDLGFDAMFYVVREQARLIRQCYMDGYKWPEPAHGGKNILVPHLPANGHYLLRYMRAMASPREYPPIVFTAYKEWAIANDEWDEECEKLNPEAN